MTLLVLLKSSVGQSASVGIIGQELASAIFDVNGLGSSLETVVGIESLGSLGTIQAEGAQNGIHENLNGIQLTSTAQTITAIAESLVIAQVNSIELISSQFHITGNVSVTASINSSQSNSFVSSIDTNCDGKSTLDGFYAQSEINYLNSNGAANAVISGVGISVISANISAVGDTTEQKGGGTLKRRIKQGIPLVIVKDSKVKLDGVLGIANAGKLNAFGVISINANANIIGIKDVSGTSKVSAKGIQNLQDEELLMLLVA